MALVILDASVIIAFLNPSDTLHARAVAALTAHATDTLALPVSAYAEILVGPYRAGGTAPAIVEQFLARSGIRVEPLTREVARRAALLRAQHATLRLPDALVLATAEEVAAEVVLTGDRVWAKMNTRVRVI